MRTLFWIVCNPWLAPSCLMLSSCMTLSASKGEQGESRDEKDAAVEMMQ